MNSIPTEAELKRWTDGKTIRSLLEDSRTIAVYGLSTSAGKDSYRVAEYLQRAGYTIVPIHPKADQILGAKCFRTLGEAPHIDVVDCFRPSAELTAIVDEAIEAKAGAVWYQLGLMDAPAARRAEAAGLKVIADRCIKIEHQQLAHPPG